jgi:uncharacterized protein (TIGR02246 family)
MRAIVPRPRTSIATIAVDVEDMSPADDERAVRDVYERLVAAFGEGRVEDYFACFAEDATFLFHDVPWLGSRDAYRAAWDGWMQRDGFAVLAVEADLIAVQLLGDTAVVTHALTTRQRTDAGEETLRERETIVFAKRGDGRWLVVHEHLSPLPD